MELTVQDARTKYETKYNQTKTTKNDKANNSKNKYVPREFVW